MPSRHGKLAYCSAPRFINNAHRSWPKPHASRMCRTTVTTNPFRSGPHIASPCPGSGCMTSQNYTCDRSLAAMKAYFEKHYELTSQGHFVEICDACVPDLIAAQPPEHCLDIASSTALSPTITLKSYEPCQCSNQYRNIIAQPFCYPCATALLDAREILIFSRADDHPCYQEPLPPPNGWTCLCGKNFDTASDGRALHKASICLGCAHYKIRDPEIVPEVAPESPLRTSVSPSSSSSTLTTSSSAPYDLSTANTTPASPPPSPPVADESSSSSSSSSGDADEDTPMTGTAAKTDKDLVFHGIDYQQTLPSHYAIHKDDEGPMSERWDDL